MSNLTPDEQDRRIAVFGFDRPAAPHDDLTVATDDDLVADLKRWGFGNHASYTTGSGSHLVIAPPRDTDGAHYDLAASEYSHRDTNPSFLDIAREILERVAAGEWRGA
jgi:hypothetical protein